MKAKKIKRICIGAVILAVVLFAYLWATRAEISGRAANLVEDYQGYYLAAKWRQGWFNFGYGRPWVKEIYFLPGQKGAMLRKIKEDIVNGLETLTTEHGDLFYKYEVSDDFRQMRIYEVIEDARYIIRNEELGKIGRLADLVTLYYKIKEGFTTSLDYVNGEGIIFVEPDG